MSKRYSHIKIPKISGILIVQFQTEGIVSFQLRISTALTKIYDTQYHVIQSETPISKCYPIGYKLKCVSKIVKRKQE